MIAVSSGLNGTPADAHVRCHIGLNARNDNTFGTGLEAHPLKEESMKSRTGFRGARHPWSRFRVSL